MGISKRRRWEEDGPKRPKTNFRTRRNAPSCKSTSRQSIKSTMSIKPKAATGRRERPLSGRKDGTKIDHLFDRFCINDLTIVSLLRFLFLKIPKRNLSER